MATGKKTGGRQKGTLNKRTEQIKSLVTAGIDALEPSMLAIMEGNARYFLRQAEDAEAALATLRPGITLEPQEQFNLILAEVKKAAGLRVLAGDAAKNAAVYRHARLTAIEHTGKGGGAIDLNVIKRVIVEPGNSDSGSVPAASGAG